MASGARDAGPAGRLAARAAVAPGEPWLFYRGVPDWRWHALGAVAAEAAALASAPFTDVGGVERRLTPDAVIADLGRQLAGASVEVRRGDDRRRLDAAALASAADELEARLAPHLSDHDRPGRDKSDRHRPIAVLGGRLDRPATRAVLAWATADGAVLALEPDDDAWLDAAVWVRPTVALAPPAIAPAAAVEALLGLGRWNRLRALLVDERDVPDAPDGWHRAGVAVVPVPSQALWRRGT